jgi:DNA mismatch repair ATPase MutS
MFANTNDVKQITGKVVNNQLVNRAQYVIEAFVGKMEDEIENLKDIEILKRAVAYQSAYMENNEDIVYEQMAVSTTGQNDAYTTFRNNDTNSPWIAPLAVIICGKLSFMKGRSIYTGRNTVSYLPNDWTTI